MTAKRIQRKSQVIHLEEIPGNCTEYAKCMEGQDAKAENRRIGEISLSRMFPYLNLLPHKRIKNNLSIAYS